MKVYVDMDGVLADFYAEYAKMVDGPISREFISAAVFAPTREKMIGTDFFNRLPKFNTTDNLIESIVKLVGDYAILSAPLRDDYENSAYWKCIWLNRELKIAPGDAIFESTKEKYAVDKVNGLPNILIDDKASNIEKWINEGGYGILYSAYNDNVSDVVTQMEKYLDI